MASSTSSPEMSMSPTPIVCPTPRQVPSYEPRAYYFLIDNSNSYSGTVKEATDSIVEELPHVLQPGDSLTIGLIGKQSHTDSHLILSEQIPSLHLPEPPQAPNATVTTTQPKFLPTPTRPLTPTDKQKQQWENDKGAIEATNTREAAAPKLTAVARGGKIRQKYCDEVSGWNNAIEGTLDEQDAKRELVLEQVRDELNEISNSQATGFEVATEYQSALYIASDHLEKKLKTDKYVEATLIIVSDMKATDTKGLTESEIDFNFTNTDVVFYRTTYSSPEKHEQLKNFWEDWFSNTGIEELDFLSSKFAAETLRERLQRR